jgi:hypothetical protein
MKCCVWLSRMSVCRGLIKNRNSLMSSVMFINTLTPNYLLKRRAVSLLKFRIPSKNMREKPTNTTMFHSVY